MEGATDPHCRRPMLWEEQEQHTGLLDWYKRLISLRTEHEVLRRGPSAPGSQMRRGVSLGMSGAAGRIGWG